MNKIDFLYVLKYSNSHLKKEVVKKYDRDYYNELLSFSIIGKDTFEPDLVIIGKALTVYENTLKLASINNMTICILKLSEFIKKIKESCH